MIEHGGWWDVVAWSLAKLIRGWKVVGTCWFAGASLFIALAYSLDKVYEARTSLVCQASKTKSLGMGADLGGLLGLAAGSDAPPPLVLSVLKSDGLALYSIRRFKLDTVWKMDPKTIPRWEDLIKAWNANFNSTVDGEGVVRVTFRDKSPELAARVLESAVRWSDSTYLILRQQYAEKNTSFLLRLLEDRKRRLMAAEDTLLRFQKTNKLIEPEFEVLTEQKMSAILQEQIASVQMRMELVKISAGEGGSEYRQLAAQFQLLKARFAALVDQPLRGRVPFPGMGGQTRIETWLEHERLKREILINGSVFQVLTQQFEQSQVESQKDIPTFTVLDSVRVPMRKVAPPRAAIAFLGMILGFTLGTFIVVFGDERRAFISIFRTHLKSS